MTDEILCKIKDRINQEIDELKENGERHSDEVRQNGLLIAEGLRMALRIIREVEGEKYEVNDCISRAAAIDAVDGIDWYHQNKNGEMVHGANSDEHQAWYKAEDIYHVLDTLPSAQPGWIPCSTELPDNDIDVLVTDGTDCAVAYWRTDAQAWDDSMHGWCDLYGLEVTAWMPLPTPYREGGTG